MKLREVVRNMNLQETIDGIRKGAEEKGVDATALIFQTTHFTEICF